ncbi:MAG: hypothetical protein RLZZ196_2851 [Bacteroidota bacterium]|jgi:hypothetical protein
MSYYANGGFNWHDLYYMPIKLREFYYRELLSAKESEKQQMDAVNSKSKASSRVRRR